MAETSYSVSVSGNNNDSNVILNSNYGNISASMNDDSNTPALTPAPTPTPEPVDSNEFLVWKDMPEDIQEKTFSVAFFSKPQTQNAITNKTFESDVWSNYCITKQIINLYRQNVINSTIYKDYAKTEPSAIIENNDGTYSFTIELLPNRFWSETNEITAADAVFSYELSKFVSQVKNETSWSNNLLSNVEEVSKYVIKFTSTQKLGYASIGKILQVNIYPKYYWEQYMTSTDVLLNSDLGINAPTVGPWLYDNYDLSNNIITYKLNPLYIKYNKGTEVFTYSEGTKVVFPDGTINLTGKESGDFLGSYKFGPYYNKLQINFYDSKTEAIQAYVDGVNTYIQSPLGYNDTEIKKLESYGNTKTIENEPIGVRYMAFNLRCWPTSSLAFRKAVCLFDRKSVTSLFSNCLDMDGMIPNENSPYFLETEGVMKESVEAKTIKERIDLAINYLKEEGWSYETEPEATGSNVLKPGKNLVGPSINYSEFYGNLSSDKFVATEQSGVVKPIDDPTITTFSGFFIRSNAIVTPTLNSNVVYYNDEPVRLINNNTKLDTDNWFIVETVLSSPQTYNWAQNGIDYIKSINQWENFGSPNTGDLMPQAVLDGFAAQGFPTASLLDGDYISINPLEIADRYLEIMDVKNNKKYILVDSTNTRISLENLNKYVKYSLEPHKFEERHFLALVAPTLAYDQPRSSMGLFIGEWLRNICGSDRAYGRLTEFTTIVDKAFTSSNSSSWYMYILGWGLRNTPDYYEEYFSKKQNTTTGGFNTPGFMNDDFDAAAVEYNTAETLSESIPGVHKMQKILFEQVPYFVLFNSDLKETYKASEMAVPIEKIGDGLAAIFGFDNFSAVLKLK